ncbi:hypothetical protein GCM10009799_29350 [Nocardiopsis rhodophaea]|uniref:Teneurin-like YD-shell domain-containing protein n=1 Tax=Nocardiopsis rhodophaea TaxID=280238 RepID=A0ABP5ELF9_9ACTN
MSENASEVTNPRARARKILVRSTALVVVASTLSTVPASALMYNHRPSVTDEQSVAGRDAFESAVAQDDSVSKAAITELADADWPTPEKVKLADTNAEPRARTLSAPANTDSTAVSIEAVPDEVLQTWQSPLRRDQESSDSATDSSDESTEVSRGEETGTRETPRESRHAPAQPEPTTPEPGRPSSPEPEMEQGREPEEAEPQEGNAQHESNEGADQAEAAGEPDKPVELESAELEVLDQKTAETLGVDGVLLRLTRTDGGSQTAPVQVGVDYSDFATAFGGDYGSRLELLALEDCDAESAPRYCSRVTDLQSENNAQARTLSAVAPASAGTGTLLAVAPSTESEKGSGDYSATPLSPSSEWNVGVQTGDFSWSYSMATPKVAGELSPGLSLGYSSQSVDGRTANSNNQTSWIGEGFSYDPGYIERRYGLCQDGKNEVADQCWARHNATLSLNGMSTELIIDSDGEWHLKDDDGSKIERLTGATNGDNDGEYWKLTTPDGTQYFFGRNRLPGWASGKPETKSAWTMPVYGDESGEPCHKSRFADSWCQQAYKWNLDYVVDVQGNAMAYYYDKETNYYGRNLTSTATPYVRGGYLKRIEYGLRSDDVFGTAAARVNFGVGERCLPTEDFDCAPSKRTKKNAKHWPDVPLDQECKKDEKCTGKHSASFFSTKKLNTITTQVHDGSDYTTVDSWKLEHKYPKPGDGTAPALWLESITHTGHVGGTETYPKITFGGTALENRVDSTSDGLAPMYKWRITSIYTETGGQVDVSYSAPECKPGQTPKPHSNTKRCYPVIWTPEGEEELTDWFHKYVVTKVAEIDLVAQQPDVITSYQYVGGAGWHFDDPDGIVPNKRKTWSVFRGYAKVKVREGAADETQSETEHLFYRGMNGDKQPSGKRSVSITDSEGGKQADDEVFNGQTREVITRNGAGGEAVEKTISTPWKKKTAERSYSWGTLNSHLVKTKTTEGYTALEEGWRTTKTVNTFDDYGYVVRTDDLGDTSTPEDDRCTRTTYARNTSKWLLDKVSRVETVAVACSKDPKRPDDVISDERTHFDGQEFGKTPTHGLPTKVERIADYDSGTAKYQTHVENTFDSYGRLVDVIDALGNKTTTAYESAAKNGAPMKMSITNALGFTTSQEYDVRSSLTAQVDANGNRTELSYDPFGRLTQVWLADRPKSDNPRPSMEFEYNVRKDAPTSVVTRRLNHDGQYITSYEIYDGLLRQRQTQGAATGGGRRIIDVFYDSRGNAVKERASYYNEEDPTDSLFIVNNDDEIPRQTETVFDGAGRATDVIQVSRGEEQRRTTTAYAGDRTLVTKPEGGTGSTTITDARGRTVELRQHHGRLPEGDYDSTTYTYAKNGKIATITDAGGSTWTYTYDLRGRRIKEDDPDTGTSTFTYNALDQKVRSTDGRGETLAHVYDALGRRIELRDDSPSGNLRAKWVYDSVAKGQLTSATRYVDGQAYTTEVRSYDQMNRPKVKDITVPEIEGELAGTYRYVNGYNPDGSLQSMGYPAAGALKKETTAFGYDELNQPTTVEGWQGLVTETIYSKTGNLLQRQFSRGAVGAKETWATRKYEEPTNRLSMTSLVHEIGDGSLSTQHYDYDDSGNILSIRDKPTDENRPSDAQCFAYDYLQRLTDVWTPATAGENACGEEPDADRLGGPAPYWDSYTYDEVGNRLAETRRRGEGQTSRTYSTPGDDEGPAHAVAQVDQTGSDGEETWTYEYDESGNMTRKTTADQDQKLTWDAEGKLEKVGNGPGETSYVYDADGQRLLRREGPVTTLYLPGQEISWTAGEEKTEATRFYQHAGETVAVRENDQKLSWLFSDHQGTGQITVDANSGAFVQRRFTVFGEERSISGEWPGQKGFVGGTVDDSTGLTQLGARAYDATIGRFISVDPLLDGSSPQQMHGYAYANNSPATQSDASGLYPCGYRPKGPKKSPLASCFSNQGNVKGTVSQGYRPPSGGGHRGPGGGGRGGYYNGGGSKSGSGGYRGGGSRGGGVATPVIKVDPYAGPSRDPKAEALGIAQSNMGGPCTGSYPAVCGPDGRSMPDDVLQRHKEGLNDVLEWLKEHAVVGAGYCLVLCVGASFQDGMISVSLGVGIGKLDLPVGASGMSPRDSTGVTPKFCGAYVVGVCVGLPNASDGSGESFSVTGAGGVGFEIGEFTVFQVDTNWSWNPADWGSPAFPIFTPEGWPERGY